MAQHQRLLEHLMGSFAEDISKSLVRDLRDSATRVEAGIQERGHPNAVVRLQLGRAYMYSIFRDVLREEIPLAIQAIQAIPKDEVPPSPPKIATHILPSSSDLDEQIRAGVIALSQPRINVVEVEDHTKDVHGLLRQYLPNKVEDMQSQPPSAPFNDAFHPKACQPKAPIASVAKETSDTVKLPEAPLNPANTLSSTAPVGAQSRGARPLDISNQTGNLPDLWFRVDGQPRSSVKEYNKITYVQGAGPPSISPRGSNPRSPTRLQGLSSDHTARNGQKDHGCCGRMCKSMKIRLDYGSDGRLIAHSIDQKFEPVSALQATDGGPLANATHPMPTADEHISSWMDDVLEKTEIKPMAQRTPDVIARSAKGRATQTSRLARKHRTQSNKWHPCRPEPPRLPADAPTVPVEGQRAMKKRLSYSERAHSPGPMGHPQSMDGKPIHGLPANHEVPAYPSAFPPERLPALEPQGRFDTERQHLARQRQWRAARDGEPFIFRSPSPTVAGSKVRAAPPRAITVRRPVTITRDHRPWTRDPDITADPPAVQVSREPVVASLPPIAHPAFMALPTVAYPSGVAHPPPAVASPNTVIYQQPVMGYPPLALGYGSPYNAQPLQPGSGLPFPAAIPPMNVG